MPQETPVMTLNPNPYWEALSPEGLEDYDQAMQYVNAIASLNKKLRKIDLNLGYDGVNIEDIPQEKIDLIVGLDICIREIYLNRINQLMPNRHNFIQHEEGVRRPVEGYHGEYYRPIIERYDYPPEKERGITIST